MEKQSVDDNGQACSACHEPVISDESPMAMAAVAEGLCLACYERRELALRKAAATGFRFGR